MKKKIFKAFNWAVGFLFIYSVCGLDSEEWVIATAMMILSGLYLAIVHQISEQKKLRKEFEE